MVKFSKMHSDGRPVITSYEDAFNYLVRTTNKISLIDAAALQIFHLQLRESIRQSESDTGARMTRDETDAYIRKWVGTVELDRYFKDASDHVAEIVHAEKAKKRRRQWLPISGAWAGFLGNMLTLFIGYGIAVFVTIYTKDERVLSLIGFVNQCFNAKF